MKGTRKHKVKEPRNWLAVDAHMRHAGNMGDNKKEHCKKECRIWKQENKKSFHDY